MNISLWFGRTQDRQTHIELTRGGLYLFIFCFHLHTLPLPSYIIIIVLLLSSAYEIRLSMYLIINGKLYGNDNDALTTHFTIIAFLTHLMYNLYIKFLERNVWIMWLYGIVVFVCMCTQHTKKCSSAKRLETGFSFFFYDCMKIYDAYNTCVFIWNANNIFCPFWPFSYEKSM